jgi:stage II sporulation protein D
VTRQRVVKHPGAAWAAAVAGAWLAAAACRTMQAEVPAGPAGLAAPVLADSAAVPPPAIRVGVLPSVERVSISVASGLVVHGRPPGETAVLVRSLPRATFAPAAPGRVKLVETGDDLEIATVSAGAPAEFLQADDTQYRGLLEVRPAEEGRLTVVNVVNLEDYLRGVVPNELSPRAFPQIEALKAQAVAARTYALAHLGDYSSKGYDVCATPACQLYRGRSSEHPLTDRAVEETRGVVATWRGRPIRAYYTSTCGGHTEEGEAIFDDDAPYLRGVACLPERSFRQTVRTTALPLAEVPGGTARDVGLLVALGIVDATEADPGRLRGLATEAEVRDWTRRLQAALGRPGCDSPVDAALTRRGTFTRHLVAAACRAEEAERLAPAEVAALLPAGDAGRLDEGERRAVALLVREGILSPLADGLLHVEVELTRASAFGLIAGAAEKAGAPALADGEVAGLAEGQMSVLHGEAADSHPVDPAVRLFRDEDGVHAAASELTLSVGDRVVYVERGGRVVYLEAERTPHGRAGGYASRYYRWEARLTPSDVARSLARYGSVGRVRDIVPRRLGVSGRVLELDVVGSEGQIDLKGLQVRWGLGLRENLFVIDRETGPRGDVQRFVITGKGFGHGVGLCQVGAFGMAQAGSTFEQILKHYYTGIRLSQPEPGGAVVGRP